MIERIKFRLQLKKDYLACEKIIKQNSITFYKAFSNIKNKHQRNGIYAVYAFCRLADDLVDEHQDLKGLLELESSLKQFVKNDTPNHFMWRALRDTAKRFYDASYDYKPFFEMLDGQKMDLDHQGFNDLEALKVYCYHVASTVGLMLIPILAPNNYKDLESFAVDLGYAMQITNILRDVGEDYQKNRIYLPQLEMEKANVTIEDIKHGKMHNEFVNLFEHLANYAEAYFKSAIDHLHLFPKDVRLPLGLSIVLYRGILNACRENEYNVFTTKNFVNDQKKHEIIQLFINQYMK